MPRTRYRVAGVAVVALVAVSVVRFVGGSEAATGDRKPVAAAATVTSADPPAVSLGADQSGTIPSDRPLQVSVTNGTLTDVAVEDGQGQPVPGDVAADGRGWHSTEPPVPETAYTVRVSAVGVDQRPFEQTLTVTSSAPSAVLHATLSPGDGEVVGIGMPAVVTFDRPVAAADRP
ncbi:MAG: hypothetical protein QOJ23_4914, partial [Actinomycetota bacterium]|nr:hypothetical protein [Actinomycetota bacterium]